MPSAFPALTVRRDGFQLRDHHVVSLQKAPFRFLSLEPGSTNARDGVEWTRELPLLDQKFSESSFSEGEAAFSAHRTGTMRMDHDDLTTQFARVLNSESNDENVQEALTPIVYAKLRAIAQQRMMDERRGHTLQATALVHEALMRLHGDRNVSAEQQTHFYGAAAEAMRRVLIDHARKKGSKKRAGNRVPLIPDVVDLAVDQDSTIIVAVDEAVSRLSQEDPRAGEVVKLRFYAGLDVNEVAKLMSLSPRTVAREWTYARTRLYQILTADE
ncbi:MAG: ECF-type sigma factor [Phycisphaerales bacterium]|nr:ECF-type sigma factor [Phycisphaerales bacterium]